MKKDTHLVLGMVLVAAAIGTMVLVPGRSGTPAAVVVPVTALARGSSSTVPARVNYLITSSAELSELWGLVDAGGSPPPIDFATNAVLAVFAGAQPTTGYAIRVAKVQDAGTRLVSITLAAPAEGCPVGQALTAPYEIVAVPATALPLAHEDISATVGCTD